MAEPSSIDSGSDAARIRQALARELDSITTFEAMARQVTLPEARAALEQLVRRAKENVAALTGTLRALDAEQEAAFAASGFGAPPALPGATPTEAPRPGSGPELRLPQEPGRVLHALPAPPSPLAGQLTIGPLRGQKL